MNYLTKSNKILETKYPEIGDKNKENSYSAITNGIEITVWPEFIDSQISALGNLFVWAYHVRIDNRSNSAIKLTARHWKIVDEQGNIQEVDGEGVIGEQPTINPYESYKYSSGVHLSFPSGIMSGNYKMRKENGEIFTVEIPSFSLDIPNKKEVIN